ncbi:MAG: stage III sporulation protein AD [Clostridiaceae bacterium]|nr:stage III sporulation protein AD [Clostridiaceae bacterium]
MIVKIAAIAIVGAITSVILRSIKPEFCIGIAIACSVLIILTIKDDIAAVIDVMMQYANDTGIQTTYIIMLIKIIGIAYLTQFAASICEDAGEKTIAMKVEFAGKVAIMIMSAPLMFTIINLITGILP